MAVESCARKGCHHGGHHNTDAVPPWHWLPRFQLWLRGRRGGRDAYLYGFTVLFLPGSQRNLHGLPPFHELRLSPYRLTPLHNPYVTAMPGQVSSNVDRGPLARKRDVGFIYHNNRLRELQQQAAELEIENPFPAPAKQATGGY